MAQAVKQASSALRTAQQHCSAPVQPTRTHRRGYPAQAAPRALSPQLHEDAPSQQGSSAQGMSREVRKALCKTVKAQRKALERQLKCGAVVAPAAFEVTASPGAEVVVNSLVQQLRELELQRQRTQQALTATQAAQGPIFGAADAALTQAGPAPPPPQPARIQVCVGKPCAARGGQQLLQAVATLADGNTAVEVTPCKCLGKCKLGAALRVREVGTRPTTYTQVTTDQVSDLLEPHLAAAVEARRSMAPQPGPTQAAPVHGTA